MEDPMYLVREVVHCRPGKVREMTNKFKQLSEVMDRVGGKSMRLLTDVSGAPFWTLVAETEVETLDAFWQLESDVMADSEAQAAMSGYHDLVRDGRREFYRIER
jgi:hypothetical protein